MWNPNLHTALMDDMNFLFDLLAVEAGYPESMMPELRAKLHDHGYDLEYPVNAYGILPRPFHAQCPTPETLITFDTIPVMESNIARSANGRVTMTHRIYSTKRGGAVESVPLLAAEMTLNVLHPPLDDQQSRLPIAHNP